MAIDMVIEVGGFVLRSILRFLFEAAVEGAWDAGSRKLSPRRKPTVIFSPPRAGGVARRR